jgi:predicted DNA-binding protein with PD1-like motif
MKYTEAKQGRLFILRLEHGDVITDTIQGFAKEKGIQSAYVQIVGGAEKGSKIVVGPEDGQATKPQKIYHHTAGVTEMFGVGTLFTNETGEPKLHLHSSFGRGEDAKTGCCWPGVVTWHIGEVIIHEILTDKASRKLNKDNGFELLEIE